MTRHAEMERPDEVQEAGVHADPSPFFLDVVMVPIDYTPRHRSDVAA